MGAVAGDRATWGWSPQLPEFNAGLVPKPPAAGGRGVWGQSPQHSLIF